MTAPSSILLSVVIPLFNEQDNVAMLYQRLKAVLLASGLAHEMILVDNGSVDRTLEMLQRLASQDPCLRFLSLSRNFGHQGGLIAGLEHARGDVVVSMDGDLQHPPEIIPLLLEQWRQGYEVVFTLKKTDQTQSFMRQQINRLFYATVSRLSGLNITGGQSDFRLMDRKALDAMLALPERTKFLRGLSQWIGFRQTGVEFQVAQRFAGHSKFRIRELFNFALNGIFSFSIVPLRFFTIIGTFSACLSLLYVVYGVLNTWYKQFMEIPIVAGFPTLAAGIFFLGGVQLIGIGLLGEYLGKVYDEVKKRPAYILRQHSDQPSETMESNA